MFVEFAALAMGSGMRHDDRRVGMTAAIEQRDAVEVRRGMRPGEFEVSLPPCRTWRGDQGRPLEARIGTEPNQGHAEVQGLRPEPVDAGQVVERRAVADRDDQHRIRRRPRLAQSGMALDHRRRGMVAEQHIAPLISRGRNPAG